MNKKNKVVLIGTGSVGMSFAYSVLINSNIDELVFIDLNMDKALGEVMDLQHGTPFTNRQIELRIGSYADCRDADLVVITAGAIQKPGETRLDLTITDTKIVRSITKKIMHNGFDGILIVACNPVDIMTYVAQKVSNLPKHKVLGTGTLLDTARLQFMIGKELGISCKNIHAYILGEHGDTSFVPWDHAYIGNQPIRDYISKRDLDETILSKIYSDVRNAGYEIVNRKQSTYYGIGLALSHLIRIILQNGKSILTVSAYQNGEYGYHGIYNGVPAIISRSGIEEIIELDLSKEDKNHFIESCQTLDKIIQTTVTPLL